LREELSEDRSPPWYRLPAPEHDETNNGSEEEKTDGR
jgi:hypothetical protein